MAPLPPRPQSATVAAISKAYEAEFAAKPPFRWHLGASLIGEDCRRKLWLSFRWTRRPSFTGRQLRLFDTGNHAEGRFVADLRRIGCTVLEKDPETGRQWNVSAHGGHFGGSMDAKVLGVPEASRTWHVAEFKTHNSKSFAKLEKDGVGTAKPLHYAQMQTYMHLGDLERALYLAVNKDDDSLYSERIHADDGFAKQQLAKAGDVINAPTAPPRIAVDPSSYLCRWCDFRDICWKLATSTERNCRTCCHATPVMSGDGAWRCEKHAETIPSEVVASGCRDHRLLPDVVAGEVVGVDGDNITYRMRDGSAWTDAGSAP